MTRFPRDRFDEVADGPRVGAHRGLPRRGRGWIAFAWAALATGVLVGIGVLVLALLNGSVQFSGGDTDAGGAPSSSPSATSAPSASASADAGAAAEETAEPSAQGQTTLVVLNGTGTAGLAASGQAKLQAAGWTVTASGNAGATDATTTTVYYQQESQAALARGVAKALGVGVVQQSAAFPNADVSVVLGADFTG